MKQNVHALIALVFVMTLCSCGGGGGGGGSKSTPDTTAPQIHIDALGMQGGLDELASVTVNSIADQDALSDANFIVLINMGSGGLPADPDKGSDASGSLMMTATDPSNNVGGQELDLIIHH